MQEVLTKYLEEGKAYMIIKPVSCTKQTNTTQQAQRQKTFITWAASSDKMLSNMCKMHSFK